MTADLLRTFLRGGGIFVAALTCPAGSIAADLPSEPFGYVTEISGKWFAGERQLALWSPLQTDATIKVADPAKSDRLQILKRESNSHLTIDCSEVKCTELIRLNSFVQQPADGLGRRISAASKVIFDAVVDQLQQHPGRYSYHAARGGELADSVVREANGAIDVAPVFANLDRGRYWLRIQPVEGASEAAAPVVYEWDPGSPATLQARPAPSRLQELMLLRRLGESLFPTGQSAWILVCPSRRYESAAQAFKEVTSLTAQWHGEIDAGAKTTFMRAYLDHLADQCR